MDISPVTDRPAITAPEPEDVAAIVDLATAVATFSVEEIATVRELIDEHFSLGTEASGYHFFVARPGRAEAGTRDLLGFACFGPRPLTQGTYDLYWIVVAPQAGRQGVGAALLERVAGAVRQQGGRLLVAETSGTPGYVPARQFYLGHGFDQVATIAGFYAPGDDLVLFVRRL
ncbi:MAG TPA: GNAT family N-acetyltransferase [Anaerolineae bacterium]